MKAIRWGDNDKYFGPFTYARKGYKGIALTLGSGDGEEYPGCRLRLSMAGHTLIIALPAIIQPWRIKRFPTSWDAATVERLGRDWYWDQHERQYGFSCSDGFLQVFLGRQTHDSSTTQSWSKFIPWRNWRHVRHSYYDLAGNLFWTEPKKEAARKFGPWPSWYEAKQACPSVSFAFKDFDGEALTAKTQIEERVWLFGDGWFKWLGWFRAPMIQRSLGIDFSNETGRRKGSWKGGTVGHSIEMLPGELHEAAFRRYCAAFEMTFVEPIAVAA